MENGDQIRVIMDSNGGSFDATYIEHDMIGLTYITEADQVRFMPWHAIRLLHLVTATEDIHRKDEGQVA